MPHPQAGILPEPNQNALFLILRVCDPAKNGAAVAKVAAGVLSLVDEIASHDRGATLVCTASFGAGFWEVISPRKRPKGLRPKTAKS